MTESDPDRLAEVRRQIRDMKEKDHSVIRFADPDVPIVHEFKWRKWAEIPEGSKLAMLQDLCCWKGITNRDMATILLIELDVGKLSTGQRDMLIRLAAPEQQGKRSLKDLKCGHGNPVQQKVKDRSRDR